MVIEASILARLFRLRLLTLDATLLLLPANADGEATIERPAPSRQGSRASYGIDLSDALRSIDEADDLLRRAQANVLQLPR